MITYDRLHELLDYDKETGLFTWKVDKGMARIGDICRCESNGYIVIGIDGNNYRANRLAWLYCKGYMSENFIDHKNRIRNDNRICNLREVNQSCNLRNKGIQSNNTSGIIGVNFDTCRGKWLARIKADGRQINCGRYNSKVDAAKARWLAEVKYCFPDCNTTSSAYQYLKKHGAI